MQIQIINISVDSSCNEYVEIIKESELFLRNHF